MAKIVRTKNDQQQQIVKLLNAMTGKFSLWQIWQDFITLMAISIANRFPGLYWQKREDVYLNTIKKYSKTEQQTFANMLALLVDGLDRNSDQDFLGELFMALELGTDGGFVNLHFLLLSFVICTRSAPRTPTRSARAQIRTSAGTGGRPQRGEISLDGRRNGG